MECRFTKVAGSVTPAGGGCSDWSIVVFLSSLFPSQEDGNAVVEPTLEVDKKDKARGVKAKEKGRRVIPCACQQSRCGGEGHV